jgi:hypothetical protein
MSLEPYEHARRHFQLRRGARPISADWSKGTRDRHSRLYNRVARIWRVLIATPIAFVVALWSGARPSRGLTRKVDEVVERHADRLVALRASVFRYGADDPDHTQWDQEVARFIHAQLAEVLDAAELAAVECHFGEIHSRVAQRVGEIAADQWVYP